MSCIPRLGFSLVGLAAASLLSGTTSHAQGALHMTVGFAGNPAQSKSVPAAGIYDLNGDGKFDETGPELFAFMRKVFSVNGGNGGFFEDERHIVEDGDIVFYFADGGDGYVVRAHDANGNGVIDDPESTVFFQFGTSRTFGPDTIEVATINKRTVVYTGLDRSSSRPTGIWRSEDKNNNGNAKDAGETVKLLDKTSALVFPGKAGNVTLANDNWQRVRYVPLTKDIIGWNEVGTKRNVNRKNVPNVTPDTGVFYGFRENAGTLTAHRVFFNPSKINGLPENADIASGALEDMDLAMTIDMVKYQFSGWQFFEIDQDGFLNRFPVYYFANNYGPRRSFGSKNLAGTLLHGIVLRGIDRNRDGDLQDKGEVTVFFNGSGNAVKGGAAGTVKVTNWTETGRGTVSQVAQFITGLAELNGTIYVFVEDGKNDYVLALVDKNKSGVIETGEVTQVYRTPNTHVPQLFNQTFGPFSLELHAIDRNLIVDPLPTGVTSFRRGCLTSSGLRPAMSARGGVPKTGNRGLQVEMKRGEAQKVALLWLGLSKDKLLGVINLPFALDFLGLTGCFQHVSTDLLFPTVSNTGGGATWPLPLPADTRLKNVSLFFQAWSQDPAANTPGWVTSGGLQIVIQ